MTGIPHKNLYFWRISDHFLWMSYSSRSHLPCFWSFYIWWDWLSFHLW